jgi:Uma2 family endonuclease
MESSSGDEMPTTTPPDSRHEEPPLPLIPPLKPGDHLSRAEFERRYEAMPHLKKAELLEGVVYMPSPVNHEHHGRPHFNFNGWLFVYAASTPGVAGGDNSSLRLVKDEAQPDSFLYVLPSHGGQARVDADGYVVHAPDLIGEVAATSASYDLGVKLKVYRNHGVREYIVWRVFDREVDWFILRGAEYERLQLPADGIYRSEVLPGLWLDVKALLEHNLPGLQAGVQHGLVTQEHRQFVERLARHAAQP